MPVAPTTALHRSPDLGRIPDLARSAPRERTLEMFRRMALTRAFEQRTLRAQAEKDVRALIYLSLGQEAVAAGVSMCARGARVLGQHRAHGTYLSFGGDIDTLIDELLGLPTGNCGGRGGSPTIHDREAGIIGHNGLIGDQVPVAVGVALADRSRPVVTFFGDGAAEEDYVLAAMGMAATHRLPVLFVCEDNNRSVLTPVETRRTWRVADVARGFGLEAADIADDPWLIDHWTGEFMARLPALINIHTCRDVWHVGIGNDGDAEWNRYELVRREIADLGLADEAARVETETRDYVDERWNARLRIRSGS